MRIMGTTIEVAKAAGVSQATVSRVLNNKSVPVATAKRVRAAMEQVGYVPREQRVNGASTLKGLVCILLLDEDKRVQRLPGMMLQKLLGAEQALAKAGYAAVIARIEADGQLPPILKESHVAGVLLWGHRASVMASEQLGDLPHAWLASHVDRTQRVVFQGNFAVGQLAGEYLLQHRCRHLAYLMLGSENPGMGPRREGFEYAVRKAGLEPLLIIDADCEPVYELQTLPQTLAAAATLVDRLLAADPRPTGLFVPDDRLTVAVYRALIARGVNITDTFAIVSCNNDAALLMGLHPRPASIDIGSHLIGRKAAEKLVGLIEGQTADDRMEVFIEPLLVEGDPPPA